jgi:uncharacterized OsmC-like protein
MGIKANELGVNLEGMNITASKIMTNSPYRRIDKLILKITFAKRLNEKEFQILSNVVNICPVTKSLSKDIKLDYNFDFKS